MKSKLPGAAEPPPRSRHAESGRRTARADPCAAPQPSRGPSGGPPSAAARHLVSGQPSGTAGRLGPGLQLRPARRGRAGRQGRSTSWPASIPAMTPRSPSPSSCSPGTEVKTPRPNAPHGPEAGEALERSVPGPSARPRHPAQPRQRCRCCCPCGHPSSRPPPPRHEMLYRLNDYSGDLTNKRPHRSLQNCIPPPSRQAASAPSTARAAAALPAGTP